MACDLSIEIIRRCNNMCVHCSSRSTAQSREMLDVSCLSGLLDDAVRIGVGRVCLSGGEPLLHPQVEEIARIFSQAGLEVSIYSCGIVGLGESSGPISTSFAERLAKAGVASVIFNFPAATEATYDSVTGTRGHFPMLVSSICSTVSSGIRSEGHFVPMPLNLGELHAAVELAEELGLARLSLLRLVEHGRAADNHDRLKFSPEQSKRLEAEIDQICRSKPGFVRVGIPFSGVGPGCLECHAIDGKLYVKYDGSIYGCEAFKYIELADKGGKPVEPLNLAEATLFEAVTASEHMRLCREMILRHLRNQQRRESCPVQEYLRCD